jgi:hypothetical protein
MSKKRKAKISRARCPACRSPMKARDVACRKCGRPAVAGKLAGGTVVPFLAKAAAQARPRCPLGHGTGRPGAAHCTRCGSFLDFSSPQTEAVSKAVGASRGGGSQWAADFYREPDPARRQWLWELMHPETKGGEQA